AGNSEAIERAKRAFPTWLERTRARLGERPRSWRWPVEYATALSSMAGFYYTIGRIEEGMELDRRLLALGLPAKKEAALRLGLGYRYGHQGRINQALVHLERAAELDPDNRRIQQALAEMRRRRARKR
ncbi:MAG: hypothetical protein D6815_02280, partial [Candidatus Dadabacteria bacterium]